MRRRHRAREKERVRRCDGGGVFARPLVRANIHVRPCCVCVRVCVRARVCVCVCMYLISSRICGAIERYGRGGSTVGFSAQSASTHMCARTRAHHTCAQRTDGRLAGRGRGWAELSRRGRDGTARVRCDLYLFTALLRWWYCGVGQRSAVRVRVCARTHFRSGRSAATHLRSHIMARPCS